MGDKLLSQSDIDSLVSGLLVQVSASPRAKAEPAAGVVSHKVSQPSREVSASPPVRQASSPDATPKGQPRVADTPPQSDSSPGTNVADLVERLSRVETTVKRLEQLEKGGASAGAGQVSLQKVQAMAKRVLELSEEVKSISAKLRCTLAYDVYHSFKCDSCSSQGLVATVLRCTKCGHESWRGWWPKK